MPLKKPDFYNNLDKTHDKIWSLLDKGFLNRDDSFHIPVFICGDESNFGGRIVVLRGLDKKNKIITFHSDIRSNKIFILKSKPQGSFLFYDKKEKIQLRILCSIKIHYQNTRIRFWFFFFLS